MSFRPTGTLDPRWDYLGPCKCGGCDSCMSAQGFSRCVLCGHFDCDCDQEMRDNGCSDCPGCGNAPGDCECEK